MTAYYSQAIWLAGRFHRLFKASPPAAKASQRNEDLSLVPLDIRHAVKPDNGYTADERVQGTTRRLP